MNFQNDSTLYNSYVDPSRNIAVGDSKAELSRINRAPAGHMYIVYAMKKINSKGSLEILDI